MPKPKIPKTYDDLVPAPYNPREIEPEALDGLATSLDEFGDLSGITWNKRTGHVVCGHQRIKALRDLGAQLDSGMFRLGKVRFEIRIVDWDQAKEKRANVVANSDKITGRFTDGIKDLLAEIKGSTEPSLFEGLRLDVLADDVGISDPLGGDGEIEEDDVPEPPKEPVTKPGDVWKLGDHTVVCGDCCLDASYLNIRGQMVFTDPPYGVDYDGGAKKREKLKDDRIGTDVYKRALPLLFRFTDAKSPLYLWYADGHAAAAAAAAAAAGYRIVAQIIWAKNHAQFVSSANYKGKHEPCYYAKKKDGSRWHGPNNEVTLWEYDRSSVNEFHPTQKPVALAARAIRNSSEVGHVVVDGFLGSGTTLIAAEQLNRACHGIEIEPAYVDVVVQRWEQLTGGKAKRKRA